MSNKQVDDDKEKRCEKCGTDKTYMAVTKNRTSYPKWNSNPFKENSWICGRCYRRLLRRKALPPIHVRKGIRIARIAKRVCHKCGGKTNTQKSKTTSNDYNIWHRHPEVLTKWLCGKCYANWLFEPKRRFKTKEERYQYLAKLFSGTGNPMYGNHTLNLGRRYTEERNRRVSEGVREWARLHPEHYFRMGILGALKARELGLNGIPTNLEIIMEEALKKQNIRYIRQYEFGIGIMDFYLPEGNIALFVDGTIWHADPRIYNATDILFFGSKISKREWNKAIAADVWKKDRKHNSYLKSKGYTVIRFWEKEIKNEIDRCMKSIQKRIQACKNLNAKSENGAK